MERIKNGRTRPPFCLIENELHFDAVNRFKSEFQCKSNDRGLAWKKLVTSSTLSEGYSKKKKEKKRKKHKNQGRFHSVADTKLFTIHLIYFH